MQFRTLLWSLLRTSLLRPIHPRAITADSESYRDRTLRTSPALLMVTDDWCTWRGDTRRQRVLSLSVQRCGERVKGADECSVWQFECLGDHAAPSPVPGGSQLPLDSIPVHQRLSWQPACSEFRGYGRVHGGLVVLHGAWNVCCETLTF